MHSSEISSEDRRKNTDVGESSCVAGEVTDQSGYILIRGCKWAVDDCLNHEYFIQTTKADGGK